MKAHAAVSATPGVTIRSGRSVVGLEREAAVAALSPDDGSRINAPLAVAADSRFSSERHRAGIGARIFDFGLSGVEVLAREPARERGESALAAYESEPRRFTLPGYEGTNAIVRLFTDDALPARLARRAVLRFATALPLPRHVIPRQLTGGISRSARPRRLSRGRGTLSAPTPAP